MYKKSILKAIVAIVVALAFLAPTSPVFANDKATFDIATVSVLPYPKTVANGTSFDVEVFIAPDIFDPLMGVELFKIRYDADFITATGVTYNDFFYPYATYHPLPVDISTPGVIRNVAEMTYGDTVTAPKVFCTISFTADNVGTSAITFDEVSLYRPDASKVPVVVNDGEVTVTEDKVPPGITNVILTPSGPMDTDPDFGWENITCTVTDTGFGVDIVKLVVTDPDMHTDNILMTNIPNTDIYYYNTTLTVVGDYSYHIWANDTINNIATTTPNTFTLFPNWDVNKDGKIRGADFVLVAGYYGENGPSKGWIREDVNNDGKIRGADFIMIAGHYGEGE